MPAPEPITLITPTSDRPRAFALCERWIARQTYPGKIHWIVIDDGSVKVQCTMGQNHLRREPAPDRAQSFRRNLLAGLYRVETDLVAFVEDDDWYHADYLARLVDGLQGRELYGEGRAKYYHVGTRRHREYANLGHASLCQTGLRSSLLPWLKQRIERHESTFVDLHMWKHAPATVKRVEPQSRHCVGLKGLPGKRGIGAGHRMDERFPVDADGSVLRSWIGDDAEIYFNLMGVTV